MVSIALGLVCPGADVGSLERIRPTPPAKPPLPLAAAAVLVTERPLISAEATSETGSVAIEGPLGEVPEEVTEAAEAISVVVRADGRAPSPSTGGPTHHDSLTVRWG